VNVFQNSEIPKMNLLA
jgi:hypothetical protein